MEKQPLNNNNNNNNPAPANTTEQLRRNILESVYKGQKQARGAQDELERQGKQLRTSFVKAELVANQTGTTANAVDDLISEAKASKFRKFLRCCMDTCCCSRSSSSCCCKRRKRHEDETRRLYGAMSPTIDDIKDDLDDNQTLIILDSLKSNVGGRATNKWKKTLAPQPGATLQSGTAGIWYRQVDASLTQLQHIAEDMGQSLDEQIRLAQMLTIYLNYGVDQVIGANERLGKASI